MPPDENDQRAFIMEQGTGMIYVRIRRERYVIDPPLLGELRQLELVADQVVKVEGEQVPSTVVATSGPGAGDDSDVGPLPQSERDRTILPWWRKLFELCETQSKPLPPDDECPPWMGNGMLVVAICLFWQQFPLGDPGTSGNVTPQITQLITQSLSRPTTNAGG